MEGGDGVSDGVGDGMRRVMGWVMGGDEDVDGVGVVGDGLGRGW